MTEISFWGWVYIALNIICAVGATWAGVAAFLKEEREGDHKD